MKERLIKAGRGIGGIALCALLAHGVCFILPSRGALRLAWGLMGMLVALLAIQLRRVGRWQPSDFLFSLVGAEVVAALAAILFLSPPADPWRWFIQITLFIALPWALGYGLGTVSLVGTERQKPVLLRSWIVAAVYTLCGLMALVFVPEFRHAYGQFAAPVPRLTLFFIRVSPELWFFLALGCAAFAVFKDLVFRQKWLNVVLPIPLVLLILALFLPLV